MPAAALTHVRPLRVLYLTWRDRDNPEAGGSETFVERTAEVIAQSGGDVTIFSAAFPGAERRDWHGPVRVVRSGGRFLCYAAGLRHLLRHRSSYDVVVDIHNGVPFWSPLVAGRTPVVSVVHHVHKDQWPTIFGPVLGRFGWFLESRVAPLLYRRSQYVTVSKATRTELAGLGISPERVEVVYSGNDHPPNLSSYAAVPRTAYPSLMVLGRLVPHKHNEVAIDIVAALSERHPDLVLHVVGTGYWLDALREHAAKQGVADRVIFHGFVDEHTKHTLLASSWLVLMPSQKEGWGLTIVEAGLHATPALAYSFAGGVTESIVDGETGLLAADDAEMLAHVESLLGDSALRMKYGENARRHALSFAWESTGRHLESVLRRAIGQRGSGVVTTSTPRVEA